MWYSWNGHSVLTKYSYKLLQNGLKLYEMLIKIMFHISSKFSRPPCILILCDSQLQSGSTEPNNNSQDKIMSQKLVFGQFFKVAIYRQENTK